ncbi:integrase core domain protein [Oesophagostomum dentatum]|uniref:Integrase core domain protein n=1 Tax=Oesophagostomum dentatum TaxID=61180 RepID=A0A0B1SZA4_OESDE|nr:integrase core domain protein [Oesophagostomum dentatum]
MYDPADDVFTVRTKFPNKNFLTKKDVVSQINSIFDPIGTCGPLVVRLKAMMREVFDTGIDWKTPLPEKTRQKWLKLCKEVDNASVSINRCVPLPMSEQKYLWAFADASDTAIATCAYIQCMPSGKISQLISGKTRLTPKKCRQTIPKLELLAVLIAMRLTNTILSTTNNIDKVNIVSDSEIALYWIKSMKKAPVFVSNQREKILHLKKQFKNKGVIVAFFHVTTDHNPADAGTRGLNSQQINNHSWIIGPKWLEENPNKWPIKSLDNIPYEEETEQNNVETSVQVQKESENKDDEKLADLTRFSKMNVLLRVIARVGKVAQKWARRTSVKFVQPITLINVSQFNSDSEISAADMDLAEKILLADEHKHIDLKVLKKRFHEKSVEKDEHGIIRHYSRLQNAFIPQDARSPIYIPHDSELSRLIIQKIHAENGHCGMDHTLSLIRQRFWIPKPSYVFRKHIKRCVTCKKYQGLPFGAPTMPPLPKDRVIASKPFQTVGCDFMGPFMTKTQEKMYICLYTCLTTRAIHLEVAENLSTGAFLNSFIRFISRRGVPKIIRSDCGTNFKLGEAIIAKMFEQDETSGNSVMSYCASERITWIFNPPGSPWMGGAWERLVGLVKKAFNKSVGRKRLTFVEMCTVTARIEAIVNTRPLTKLNSSEISELPLRPIDFLRGNLHFSLPDHDNITVPNDPDYDPNLIQTEKQAIEAFKHSEAIADKFWDSWSREYLTSLRDQQKIHLKQPRHLSRSPPEIGEIVIIEQELIPRGSWMYGKITEIITSKDGLIRTAKILQPNRKIIQRPLNKIFPLEIRSLACGEHHAGTSSTKNILPGKKKTTGTHDKNTSVRYNQRF